MRGNRKTKVVQTINGKIINNAVLNKCGIPQLSDSLSFLTISSSGSVRDRSKPKNDADNML
jgi:hypothetical protein